MNGKISLAGLAGITCALLLSTAACSAGKNAVEPVYTGTKSVSDFAGVLEQNPNGVFANNNGEQIRTQIISFQFVEGNKVYFGTGSEKPLYQQLIRFPYIPIMT